MAILGACVDKVRLLHVTGPTECHTTLYNSNRRDTLSRSLVWQSWRPHAPCNTTRALVNQKPHHIRHQSVRITTHATARAATYPRETSRAETGRKTKYIPKRNVVYPCRFVDHTKDPIPTHLGNTYLKLQLLRRERHPKLMATSRLCSPPRNTERHDRSIYWTVENIGRAIDAAYGYMTVYGCSASPWGSRHSAFQSGHDKYTSITPFSWYWTYYQLVVQCTTLAGLADFLERGVA